MLNFNIYNKAPPAAAVVLYPFSFTFHLECWYVLVCARNGKLAGGFFCAWKSVLYRVAVLYPRQSRVGGVESTIPRKERCVGACFTFFFSEPRETANNPAGKGEYLYIIVVLLFTLTI